jgi:hypothetical protein
VSGWCLCHVPKCLFCLFGMSVSSHSKNLGSRQACALMMRTACDVSRAALFDHQHVVYPCNLAPIYCGHTNQGKYTRTSLSGHHINLREDFARKGAYTLSVHYSDGACAILRGSQVSFSSVDGVHVTVNPDGVWQRLATSRKPLSWEDVCLQRTQLSAGAAVAKEQSLSQLSQHSSASLQSADPASASPDLAKPSGAPGLHGPEAAGLYATGVLESGSVVVRRSDGSAEALLADGCVGTLVGDTWEWTNTRGRRMAEDPRFDVPQHR